MKPVKQGERRLIICHVFELLSEKFQPASARKQHFTPTFDPNLDAQFRILEYQSWSLQLTGPLPHVVGDLVGNSPEDPSRFCIPKPFIVGHSHGIAFNLVVHM